MRTTNNLLYLATCLFTLFISCETTDSNINSREEIVNNNKDQENKNSRIISPLCEITGPSTICKTAEFSAVTDIPNPVYEWSVVPESTLLLLNNNSNSTFKVSVIESKKFVSVKIKLRITSTSSNDSCVLEKVLTKSCNTTTPLCRITGPSTICKTAEFSAVTDIPNPVYEWSVIPEGTLLQLNNNSNSTFKVGVVEFKKFISVKIKLLITSTSSNDSCVLEKVLTKSCKITGEEDNDNCKCATIRFTQDICASIHPFWRFTVHNDGANSIDWSITNGSITNGSRYSVNFKPNKNSSFTLTGTSKKYCEKSKKYLVKKIYYYNSYGSDCSAGRVSYSSCYEESSGGDGDDGDIIIK